MPREITTPADLIEFVERERVAAVAAETLRRSLSIEEVVERGDAIQGLVVTATSPDRMVFRCPENESRLRIGDKIELQSGMARCTGTIADFRDGGRELHLLSAQAGNEMAPGPWVAQLIPIDVSGLIIACLKKLMPGAPGWSFFRSCFGELPVAHTRRAPDTTTRTSVLDGLLADQVVGASQNAVLLTCSQSPPVFAAQGPPGTGKTRVLALAAEALARAGKRTLVLAPTHQAVNNALSTIRRAFPERRILKVGDELRRESLEEGIDCELFTDGTRRSRRPVSSETITGMTFVSAFLHLILRRSALAPHAVLIDEAGQLPLAQGVCAGLIGAGSILMFGDDMQMPPVFSAEVATDPLARSLFQSIRAHQPEAVSTLSTTYRLNSGLCAVISNAFYSGILESDASARDRQLRIDLSGQRPGGSVAEALTSVGSFIVVHSPRSDATHANILEADFVAETVDVCVRAGIPSEGIAVVTPFRRQAALIRNKIQSRLSTGVGVPIVDTVERVQGLTVELVLVSMCAASPAYIASVRPFLLSPNRLNVALSRARTKAILIVSANFTDMLAAGLEGSPSTQVWQRLLASAEDEIWI